MNRFAGLEIPPLGVVEEVESFFLLQAKDCGIRLCENTECEDCLFDGKHLKEYTMWYNEQREDNHNES